MLKDASLPSGVPTPQKASAASCAEALPSGVLSRALLRAQKSCL